MRLDIPFDMLLNPYFKMTITFANIARLQPAKVNLYTRKDLKSLEIGSLYAK